MTIAHYSLKRNTVQLQAHPKGGDAPATTEAVDPESLESPTTKRSRELDEDEKVDGDDEHKAPSTSGDTHAAQELPEKEKV